MQHTLKLLVIGFIILGTALTFFDAVFYSCGFHEYKYLWQYAFFILLGAIYIWYNRKKIKIDPVHKKKIIAVGICLPIVWVFLDILVFQLNFFVFKFDWSFFDPLPKQLLDMWIKNTIFNGNTYFCTAVLFFSDKYVFEWYEFFDDFIKFKKYFVKMCNIFWISKFT